MWLWVGEGERGDEIIDFAMERWRIDPTAGPEAKTAQTSG